MIERKIVFDEPSHTYKDEEGLVYTSVTTLIGKYHAKFDENYWAKEKARELNTTPEAIKKSWKDIREYAQDKGTKTHNILEDSVNRATGKSRLEFNPDLIKDIEGNKGFLIVINKANLHILADTPLAKLYPKIYIFLKEKILEGWSLYAEKRTYWFPYLVAGTIDLLLVKGKAFIIVDWKTNKDELMFKSGYYKKDPVTKIKTTQWIDKKEYFYPPISNLEYCKGHIYTLQLSIYAHLVELWGLTCVGLYLFHIRDRDEPKLYIISYVQWAAQLLCIHNKTALTSPSSTNNPTKFGIR